MGSFGVVMHRPREGPENDPLATLVILCVQTRHEYNLTKDKLIFGVTSYQFCYDVIMTSPQAIMAFSREFFELWSLFNGKTYQKCFFQ